MKRRQKFWLNSLAFLQKWPWKMVIWSTNPTPSATYLPYLYRWRIAEVYGDFVFAYNDFIGDEFDHFTLLIRLHRLPMVIEAARL